MSHTEERGAVVAEAMTWLRTPYHHHARVKGVGVDCAQLPIAVYSAVGIIEPIAPDYSEQWMLHRAEEQYLGWVRKFAREIPREVAGPGDFAVWRFGRTYSHGAIIVDAPMIIHACRGDDCVTLANMDQDAELPRRPAIFFSPWG